MKKLICGVFAMLAAGAQASAAPFSYAFEATFFEEVTRGIDADDVPASSLFGQARGLSFVSGVLTYDEADIAPRLSDGSARYQAPVSFSLDQLALPILAETGVLRVDNAEADPNDRFNNDRLFFQASTDERATVPGRFFDDLISLRLIDSTNNAVSDLALPEEIAFSDFDSTFLALGVLIFDFDEEMDREFIGSAFVDFKITRFERIAEVPVPAALPLFLAGAAGLGAFARRRNNIRAA